MTVVADPGPPNPPTHYQHACYCTPPRPDPTRPDPTRPAHLQAIELQSLLEHEDEGDSDEEEEEASDKAEKGTRPSRVVVSAGTGGRSNTTVTASV